MGILILYVQLESWNFDQLHLNFLFGVIFIFWVVFIIGFLLTFWVVFIFGIFFNSGSVLWLEVTSQRWQHRYTDRNIDIYSQYDHSCAPCNCGKIHYHWQKSSLGGHHLYMNFIVYMRYMKWGTCVPPFSKLFGVFLCPPVHFCAPPAVHCFVNINFQKYFLLSVYKVCKFHR